MNNQIARTISVISTRSSMLRFYFGGARVKDSRRSGVSQSCFLYVFGFIRLFDELRAELIRDISRSVRFFNFFLFFHLFEFERIIILAFPGFKPTHLCDPSDEKRLEVEVLTDCVTATQGSLGYSYEIMHYFRDKIERASSLLFGLFRLFYEMRPEQEFACNM